MTEQGTLQWHRERNGNITGSMVGKIFSKGKTADKPFSDSALAYLEKVAAEKMIPRFIIDNDEFYSVYLEEVETTNKAMRIGTEREVDARLMYAGMNPQLRVDETGCIQHSTIEGFSSSPDGIVNDGEGVIEIKCPKPNTYIRYLTQVHSGEDLKKVNSTYYWQCVSHMAVTDAKWVDFTVYCPYSTLPIHIVRINRDQKEIMALEKRVKEALDYIDSMISKAVGVKKSDKAA